tara:strand:+ start:37 stop:273 length:237 start_codon:yes stop_codon:yes gene_type:complete
MPARSGNANARSQTPSIIPYPMNECQNASYTLYTLQFKREYRFFQMVRHAVFEAQKVEVNNQTHRYAKELSSIPFSPI